MSKRLDRFLTFYNWFIRLSAIAAIVALYMVMSGCAEIRTAQLAIAEHGAQAADNAIKAGKWEVCTAASIGALERELAGDRDRILGWLLYCGKKPGLLPLPSTPQPTPQSGLMPGWSTMKEIGL